MNSNYVKLNYVRHTATWNIFNHTLLTTELFYEDADDSGGMESSSPRFPASRTFNPSSPNIFIATAARFPSVIN